jgi:hypothetical protein
VARKAKRLFVHRFFTSELVLVLAPGAHRGVILAEVMSLATVGRAKAHPIPRSNERSAAVETHRLFRIREVF